MIMFPGRYCFHKHLSVHTGVPHLHPIILPLVPCTFWGVSRSGQDWEYPRMGYSPGQVRMGGGTPRLGNPDLAPQIGQEKEHLLRSGRYASCAHEGGLSCFRIKVVFGFFTIGKSDKSVRSDRNEMQFLRIITI